MKIALTKLVASLCLILASCTVAAYPFLYVSPSCPQPGDDVTLWVVSRGIYLVPASTPIMRTGNTFNVAASAAGPAPIMDFSQDYAFGQLAAGTYHVKLNSGDGPDGATIDFVVGAPTGDVTGAWYNPAAPGFGMSFYRGGRSFAGAYYTYRADSSPMWYLLQGTYCTPTGFAGFFAQYNSRVDQPEIIQGNWMFYVSSPTQGAFTEVFTNTGAPPVPVLRPLSKIQFP